jgi:HAD superfamily hydrolase (TIGR01509 family)
VAPEEPITVVLDIDGTLVDTNYQHAIAWHRALCDHGYVVQLWQIHRHIGMGGDQIVANLVGEDGEEKDGDAIREAEGEAYSELIGEVQAMHGATELLEELREDGFKAILASSAKAEEVEHYIELLGASDLVEGWTTAADVERTKPYPDLVRAALEKVGCDGPAVMVGDSTWDVKAAEAAGVPTLAVLTGGFSEAELRDAGAAEVCESIDEVRKGREELRRIAKPLRARSGQVSPGPRRTRRALRSSLALLGPGLAPRAGVLLCGLGCGARRIGTVRRRRMLGVGAAAEKFVGAESDQKEHKNDHRDDRPGEDRQGDDDDQKHGKEINEVHDALLPTIGVDDTWSASHLQDDAPSWSAEIFRLSPE